MTVPALFAPTPGADLPVEHVCDMSVDLYEPLPIETPTGLRMTYIAKPGKVTGAISGEILEGGGDWVVVGADGVSRLDIRQTIRTDDGVLIHFAAPGVVRLPADGRERMARGLRVPFTESYIRLTPRFETSDERYRWLAGHVFAAVGELSAGHIDWRIYKII
ncbi:DUF3237 domain-containing protein [Solicola gregarius]|uniref:UPF0311 protein L0C25_04640 n=1 Tax=Solicola gregarius TaxID=2908642 RepID=A0AA46TJ89_9ACTN|nr:DUF3237 domain-containing protein [Solicola gregarius]UYM06369.1 DUF3237 domain-containing protein [Solicola gregarius]